VWNRQTQSAWTFLVDTVIPEKRFEFFLFDVSISSIASAVDFFSFLNISVFISLAFDL
jgi:hypothetical protein